MTDVPPYRALVGVEVEQGLLAQRDLREHVDKLQAEGFPHHVVVAAIGALAGGLIAEHTNIATASAWFYGTALQCAKIAAAELPDTQH